MSRHRLALAGAALVWVFVHRGGAVADDAVVEAGATAPAVRVTLRFSSRLGGRGEDQLRDVRVDERGGVVVVGYTHSRVADFPGATRLGPLGRRDGLVARFAPDGSLRWVTLVGGSGEDWLFGLDVASDGDLVVAGGTTSRDLPGGDGHPPPRYRGDTGGDYGDVWVARLAPDGRRVRWCTTLGGRGNEAARGGVVLDARDRPHVAGWTASPDLLAPAARGSDVRANARPGGATDAVWVRLAADGSGAERARFFGSPGDREPEELVRGVAFDAGGGLALVAIVRAPGAATTPDAEAPRFRGGPADVLLARLDAEGRLLYASHLGGSGGDWAQRPLRDAHGHVFVTGSTGSRDLPVRAAPQPRYGGGRRDQFLVRLAPDLRPLALSYYGGSGAEGSHGSALDPAGRFWAIYGTTASRDLPGVTASPSPGAGAGDTPRGALQGETDAYLALFDPVTVRTLYATYFGGSAWERGSAAHAAVDGSGTVGPGGSAAASWLAVVGATSSPDFPTTPGAHRRAPAGDRDATVSLFRVVRSTEEPAAGARAR